MCHKLSITCTVLARQADVKEVSSSATLILSSTRPCRQERIMREGRGRGGKEREAPTHLIKNSELTHATRVTKNR